MKHRRLPRLPHSVGVRVLVGAVALGSFVSGCKSKPAPDFADAAAAVAPATSVAPLPEPKPVSPPPIPPAAAKDDPRANLRAYLTEHLPKNGKLKEDGDAIRVIHTVQAGDTAQKIAADYVDLTTHYGEGDLATAINKANPDLAQKGFAKGTELEIPNVMREYKTAAQARLPWPEDKNLRGVYANVVMVSPPKFPKVIDYMAQRGLNGIVVDAKDAPGLFTYPTKVDLAQDPNAKKYMTIPSLPRLVRFAHSRNVRVIMRVTCFHDAYMARKRPDFSIQARTGGPARWLAWMDPANEEAQNYLLSIVDEVIDAGVDEVQLDYVRFPTEKIQNADFKLRERKLTTVQVITDFVKRVHEKTKAANVPLSLDLFGVVAWRYPPDINATGQDMQKLALEVEAISPMVYPSHFAPGFNGYGSPGDHPDVAAIGTKRALDEVKKAGASAVVRPWIQAFPWRSANFGAGYVAQEIKTCAAAGGIGWLAWNSGGEYGPTWIAAPLLPEFQKPTDKDKRVSTR